LSDFGNECEVLFMIESIFRLIKIEEIKNEKIITIHMELCGDDEDDLKDFGMVTRDKGAYDSSLEWFQKSLVIHKQKGLSNYVYIGNLYNCIGNVYRMKRRQLEREH